MTYKDVWTRPQKGLLVARVGGMRLEIQRKFLLEHNKIAYRITADGREVGSAASEDKAKRRAMDYASGYRSKATPGEGLSVLMPPLPEPTVTVDAVLKQESPQMTLTFPEGVTAPEPPPLVAPEAERRHGPRAGEPVDFNDGWKRVHVSGVPLYENPIKYPGRTYVAAANCAHIVPGISWMLLFGLRKQNEGPPYIRGAGSSVLYDVDVLKNWRWDAGTSGGGRERDDTGDAAGQGDRLEPAAPGVRGAAPCAGSEPVCAVPDTGRGGGDLPLHGNQPERLELPMNEGQELKTLATAYLERQGHQYGAGQPPPHYQATINGKPVDVWDVLEAYGLDEDAYLAQAVQYLLRSPAKGERADDLRKAVDCINRRIKKLEA